LWANRQSGCANPGQLYQASRPARFAGRTPKSSPRPHPKFSEPSPQVLQTLTPSSPNPHPKFFKPSPEVLQTLTRSSPNPHPKPVEELPGFPRRFAASGRNLAPHGQTRRRAACKQLCGAGVCHCACVAWPRLCRCGAVCDAGLQRWMAAQDSRKSSVGFSIAELPKIIPKTVWRIHFYSCRNLQAGLAFGWTVLMMSRSCPSRMKHKPP